MSATGALALQNVPADPNTDSVWAWVNQLNGNHGGAVRLYTSHEFGGRWVTTVPLPAGWHVTFKFFKAPKGYDAAASGVGSPQIQWEYGGVNNDRTLDLPSLNIQAVRGPYTWGQP
jgi:hypothetical protein